MAMMDHHKSFALFAVIAMVAPAFAGAPPPPRPTIGPKDVLELAPSHNPLSQGSRPLAPDRARIINVGDRQLFITYWDGAAWQHAAIGTGRMFDAVCARCSGDIPIAFHNGKEDRTLKVRGGVSYELQWDTRASVWTLVAAAR